VPGTVPVSFKRSNTHACYSA